MVQKLGHAMVRVGRVGLDRGPGRLVDIGRQARKYHRAGGQRQHRRHQANGRWDRPGRTGDNHRVGGRLPAPGFSLAGQHPVAPHRRIDTAGGGQNHRPVGGENFQEAQCHLPMIGQFIGHQGFKTGEIQAFGMDLIDQVGERLGQAQGLVECHRRGGRTRSPHFDD